MAILGVDLAEFSHSCNDGSSNYSDVIEEEVVSAVWGAHVSRMPGTKCDSTLHPRGTKGFAL